MLGSWAGDVFRSFQYKFSFSFLFYFFHGNVELTKILLLFNQFCFFGANKWENQRPFLHILHSYIRKTRGHYYDCNTPLFNLFPIAKKERITFSYHVMASGTDYDLNRPLSDLFPNAKKQRIHFHHLFLWRHGEWNWMWLLFQHSVTCYLFERWLVGYATLSIHCYLFSISSLSWPPRPATNVTSLVLRWSGCRDRGGVFVTPMMRRKERRLRRKVNADGNLNVSAVKWRLLRTSTLKWNVSSSLICIRFSLFRNPCAVMKCVCFFLLLFQPLFNIHQVFSFKINAWWLVL